MRKHLQWAIIGAPSCGKTSLLGDLIQSFDLMGFRLEALPLSSTSSSFGAFFAETTGANGQLLQTDRYACRADDLYSACFTHPSLALTLEVDFLNLPGETFRHPERIDLFLRLRTHLNSITAPVFAIDTYVNPEGCKRHILRYAEANTDEDTNVKPWPRTMRHANYMDRQQICAELREAKYSFAKTTFLNGKKLMERFFDIEADSFYETLCSNWKRVVPELDFKTYRDQHVLFNFFPLMYCTRATDIVICDKLFRPKGNTKGIVTNYPFGELVKNVGDFVENLDDRHPHVYMAFRGADFMLHNCEANYQQYLGTLAAGESPLCRRQKAYTLFCLSLLSQLYGQTYAPETGYPDVGPYADISGGSGAPLAGMALKTHLDTRFGQDPGNGFWYLLNQMLPVARRWRKRRDFSAIYNDTCRPAMPPHVYFTSTPIDEHFCIYRNDSADASRFVYESSEKIRAFHIETAVNGVKSMCWGSLQLLDDILACNGITSPAAKYAGPLLKYFKGG